MVLEILRQPRPTTSHFKRFFDLKNLADALDRLQDILAGIESANANIPLSSLAKSSARSGNDIGFLQKFIEEIPAVALDVHPDLRRVNATGDGVSKLGKRFANEPGIFKIEVDRRLRLSLPFR